MTMQTSPRCKALITKWEGLAEVLSNGLVRAYPDPASPMGRGEYPKNGPDVSKGKPWTIGFGKTGTGITRGTVWTLDKCERALDEDILSFAKGVNRLLARYPKARTTQAQFDALVSFAYNVGIDEDRDGRAEGLGDSTLFAKHIAGQYGTFDPKTKTGTGAAGEFMKWINAGGKPVQGLKNRRADEAALYVSDS